MIAATLRLLFLRIFQPLFKLRFHRTFMSHTSKKFLFLKDARSLGCIKQILTLYTVTVLLLETSDKKILVLQRSNNVGEFLGHFGFAGGHPEVPYLDIKNL